MSGEHPVSLAYDAALATTDGELLDPTSASSGLVGSGGTIDDDMLYSSKLECSSCHDVHNKYGNNYLLVKDNAGSALCLTCHDK